MGLWDSIKNIMTIPEEDEIDEEVVETSAVEEKKRADDSVKSSESPRLIKSKAGAQPKSGAAPQLQVVLVKPDRFEDVTSIADHLNERKTVVLNLEAANRDVSRRIIDFLSGVAYANHGNIRKVANSTFIIVAHNVDVMGELMLDDYEDGKLYF